MSEQLTQDHERSQNTNVREFQNCENWEDDGTIPIIINHNVNENSNVRLHQAVNSNFISDTRPLVQALIPVNSFDEGTIAEENGVQNQLQAYRSINAVLRSCALIQEKLRANSSTLANWRRTFRNQSETRLRRLNHGQRKLLKSFKSMNKTFKKNVKMLKKIKSMLMQQIETASSPHLNNYD